MPEAYCVQHFDRKAVGNCSSCGKSFCAECLDVETSQPLCPNCKQVKAREAFKASLSGGGGPGSSPLMDDDPLGLFGGKPAASKAEPLKSAPPSPAPGMPLPVSTPPAASGLPAPSFKPPAASAGSTPLHSLNLENLIQDPKALRPPFPQAAYPAPPATGSPSSTGGDLSSKATPSSASAFENYTPTVTSSPSPVFSSGKASTRKSPFSLVKMWGKFLFRRSYELFDPLARKLRIPTFAVVGLLFLGVAGGVVGLVASSGQPSLALVDNIQPIHMVQVNSGQISEMDVTAYADLQNQIQAMGFQPILQMTVLQLPTTNFFDIYAKEDAGTYGEILKMAGQITPHLSFVTVFTNGVWFSTNAWQGTNQNMEFLVSEFYPADTPDQLYVHHIQTLKKLKEEKDWQPQSLSENRYMAALSDHLRWFLNKKGIPAYQAEFSQWH